MGPYSGFHLIDIYFLLIKTDVASIYYFLFKNWFKLLVMDGSLDKIM
tara:strand:+ start:1761 stop:1901 length:141 start_codon:yes stop_codon:yes gene_type:complete